MMFHLASLFPASLVDDIYKTFIKEDRYKLFVEGFFTTIGIAVCATLIGVLIGMLVAILRVYFSQNKQLQKLSYAFEKGLSPLRSLARLLLLSTDKLLSAYVTIIRGTPVVVQLLIIYFILFPAANNPVPVAIIAFGINSGAYVSEIIRAGILAVDRGQTEAGRSLGLSSKTTMVHIILPQAIKNILPALGNEFIAILKETSVAGYIAVVDITKAGDIVRSRTYDAFFPLISVALVYLVLVMGMTYLLRFFERMLAKSDRS